MRQRECAVTGTLATQLSFPQNSWNNYLPFCYVLVYNMQKQRLIIVSFLHLILTVFFTKLSLCYNNKAYVHITKTIIIIILLLLYKNKQCSLWTFLIVIIESIIFMHICCFFVIFCKCCIRKHKYTENVIILIKIIIISSSIIQKH